MLAIKKLARNLTRCCLALLASALIFTNTTPVMADDGPTVFITGSNRGIGFEFTKQYTELGWNVIATCRKPEKATELQALASNNDNVVIEALDVTNHEQIDALALKYKDVPIDLLLNNAGYLADIGPQKFGNIDYDLYNAHFQVNAVGPIKISEAFIENVRASDQKKIVMLGSNAGSISNLTPPINLYPYRASKAALHLGTRNLSLELAPEGIAVTLLSPGLVDTRGILDLKPGDPIPNAFTDIVPLIEKGIITLITMEESVDGMMQVIEDSSPEAPGKFINYDGTEMPW